MSAMPAAPVSAAAAEILRRPKRTSDEDITRLCVQELIACGAWEAHHTGRLEVTPTGVDPPAHAPLPWFHNRLWRAAKSSGERDLWKLVQAIHRANPELRQRLRDDIRDDLVAQGLIEQPRGLRAWIARLGWKLTPEGERVAAGAAAIVAAVTAAESVGKLDITERPMLSGDNEYVDI